MVADILLFHFLLLFYYSCPNFPPLPTFVHSTPTPTVNSHAVVHVHESFIHVLCLVPSPSFHHFLPPLYPLLTVSLFHISMSVVLFCSLDILFKKFIDFIGVTFVSKII